MRICASCLLVGVHFGDFFVTKVDLLINVIKDSLMSKTSKLKT